MSTPAASGLAALGAAVLLSLAPRLAAADPALIRDLDDRVMKGNSVIWFGPGRWLLGGPLHGELFHLAPGATEADFVRSLHFAPPSLNEYPATQLGDLSLFAGRGAVFFAYEVVRSDGTALGTYPVGGFELYGYTRRRETIAVLGEAAFVRGRDRSAGSVLRTTAAGAEKARLFEEDIYSDLSRGRIYAAGNYLWFSALGQVWRSDGTPASAVPVRPTDTAADDLAPVVEVGGRILLVDDGTLIALDPESFDAVSLAGQVVAGPVRFGSRAAFVSGRTLRATDGTRSGTVELARDVVGMRNRLFAVGETVLGVAPDNTGFVAWRPDRGRVDLSMLANAYARVPEIATTAGAFVGWSDVGDQLSVRTVDAATLRFTRLDAVSKRGRVETAPDENGGLIVAAWGDEGPWLRRLGPDGQPAGDWNNPERPFSPTRPPSLYPGPLHGVTADGQLLLGFSPIRQVDIANGDTVELPVADIARIVAQSPAGIYLISADGAVLTHYDVRTSATTTLAAGVEATFHRDRLAFFAISSTVTYGRSWYVSDGSPEGTFDLPVGPDVYISDALPREDGRLDLLVDEARSSIRSWVVLDATATLRQERRWSTASGPRGRLWAHANSTYLVAHSAGEGVLRVYQLESGDRLGMPMVLERNAPGELHLEKNFGHVGQVLLYLDSEGVRAAEVPGTVRELEVLGNRALLTVWTPEHGLEPWRWTPPEAPTLVHDIAAGPAGSRPFQLTTVDDGRVVFSAWHPALGRELWVSDGSQQGTFPVTDLDGGPRNGVHPVSPIAIGHGHVAFWGLDEAHGSEPWRLPLADLDRPVALPQPSRSELALPSSDPACGCTATGRPEGPGVIGLTLAGLLKLRRRRARSRRP